MRQKAAARFSEPPLLYKNKAMSTADIGGCRRVHFCFHSTHDLHQLKKRSSPPGYSGYGCEICGILRKTYFHALVWLYAVRALLSPPRFWSRVARGPGAGGRLFSISICSTNNFETEDIAMTIINLKRYYPLYDRKCDAGSFGRDRRRPLDGRSSVRQLQAAEAQKWRVLAGHRSRL